MTDSNREATSAVNNEQNLIFITNWKTNTKVKDKKPEILQNTCTSQVSRKDVDLSEDVLFQVLTTLSNSVKFNSH